MSRYLDSLRSRYPENLWVFDNVSVIANQGLNTDSLIDQSLGIVEGFAPSIMPGVLSTPKLEVYWDDATTSNASDSFAFEDLSFSQWTSYYDVDAQWTVEMVFMTGDAQNKEPSTDINVLWGLGNTTEVPLGFGTTWSEASQEWTLRFFFDTVETTGALFETTLEPLTRYVLSATKFQREITFVLDGKKVGNYTIPEGETERAGTFNDLYVGGEDRENHSGAWSVGSLLMDTQPHNLSEIIERHKLISNHPSPTETIGALGPTAIWVAENIGINRIEPEFDNMAKGVNNLHYNPASENLTIVDSQMNPNGFGIKELKFDLTSIPYVGPVFQRTLYTLTQDALSQPTSEIELYYRVDGGTYSIIDPDVNTGWADEVNSIWSQSTEGAI